MKSKEIFRDEIVNVNIKLTRELEATIEKYEQLSVKNYIV